MPIEEREEKDKGGRCSKRRSLRELFIKKKNTFVEEIETSKEMEAPEINVVQLNIDKKMFKKRKPNNKNMIKRTSIKIDINKMHR